MNADRDNFLSWRSRLWPGLPVLGLVTVARLLGLFQVVELQALDLGLRSRPKEAHDSRITIVSVTEADIQAVGDYPIPDQNIVQLIETIDQYQPRAIGLDIFRDLPVEPGHADFSALVQQLDHLIVIDKILGTETIGPPPAATPEQVGFVDAVLDVDGFVRRSLLGAIAESTGEYHLSFTIQLAAKYLAAEGLALENGIKDPSVMRFGEVELPRVYANTGGYINADTGGEQVLLNFRSGRDRFDTLTYQQVISGEVSSEQLAEQLADRIVLIGITAPSIKDIVNTAAIEGLNPGLVTGVEVQAHAISQILSAVLDGRPLLKVLPNWMEYGWILAWGLLGLLLARRGRRLAFFLGQVAILGLGLGAVCYGLLIIGWWIPVVPTTVAFVFNGLILYPSFRAQRDLQLRLADRQQLIERTFDQIHNGPLQKLATVLAKTAEDETTPTEVTKDLRSLNQDLRGIYEALKEEFLSAEACLRLGSDRVVRLEQPLHEILYEVYEYTLQRTEFPCFESIKFYIRKFEPMSEKGLSYERKREIGRFLEEAICNVGKYAKNCSRLTVICMKEENKNVVRVADNGRSDLPERPHTGRGTAQAQQLAKQLKGHFSRTACEPKGTCSELTWKA